VWGGATPLLAKKCLGEHAPTFLLSSIDTETPEIQKTFSTNCRENGGEHDAYVQRKKGRGWGQKQLFALLTQREETQMR